MTSSIAAWSRVRNQPIGVAWLSLQTDGDMEREEDAAGSPHRLPFSFIAQHCSVDIAHLTPAGWKRTGESARMSMIGREWANWRARNGPGD